VPIQTPLALNALLHLGRLILDQAPSPDDCVTVPQLVRFALTSSQRFQSSLEQVDLGK